MSNERNAGRKPVLTDEQLEMIKKRHNDGDSVNSLAQEYGVTRQALYKRLQAKDNKPILVSFLLDGEPITLIEADFKRRTLTIANYAIEISKRPFGFNNNPDWQLFIKVLEEKYFNGKGINEAGTYLLTDGEKNFSLADIPGIVIRNADEIPSFEFQKKDLIITRTEILYSLQKTTFQLLRL